MKRLLSFALPLVIAVTLAAWGQSDTTPSPGSTNQATSPTSGSSTQSNTQESTSTQANPATSSTMAQSGINAGSPTSLEGCVIRQQTDYFLQLDTGQPVKLNSSEDLSQHVGHRVRVQGTSTSTSGSSASNPTNSTGGEASSEANNQSQEIMVTQVETISETCPSPNQSVPNNNSQSPK